MTLAEEQVPVYDTHTHTRVIKLRPIVASTGQGRTPEKPETCKGTKQLQKGFLKTINTSILCAVCILELPQVVFKPPLLSLTDRKRLTCSAGFIVSLFGDSKRTSFLRPKI